MKNLLFFAKSYDRNKFTLSWQLINNTRAKNETNMYTSNNKIDRKKGNVLQIGDMMNEWQPLPYNPAKQGILFDEPNPERGQNGVQAYFKYPYAKILQKN